MESLYFKLRKEREARVDQSGINMVDLMMWLVIAALLLAAALQGIAYYQQAAFLYTMKSDLSGVGANVQAAATLEKNGKITTTVAQSAADQSKWSKDVTYSVDEPTVTGRLPYLRAEHAGVLDKDAIYLFENCGEEYNIGVNVIPKGSNAILEGCGITAPGTPTSGDIDGDGIPNSSDDDIDGDGIPNASDDDIDGDGTPNTSDPTPNGEEPTAGGGTDTTSPEAGGGTDTTPVSTKCTGLSVSAEVSCWMDEIVIAQKSYEAANGHYFGLALNRDWGEGTSYSHNAPELEGAPLTMGFEQDEYRPSDPYYNYNESYNYVVDREGWVWYNQMFHSTRNSQDSTSVEAPYKTSTHELHTCETVRSEDIIGMCWVVGVEQDQYSVRDARPDVKSEMTKIYNAQVNHFKANGSFYGAESTSTNVKALAGTTLDSHVWIYPLNASDGGWQYFEFIVTDTNGDAYVYRGIIDRNNPVAQPESNISMYTYTPEHIDKVCSREYVHEYQGKNTGTCQTFGYTNYKP